MITRNKLGQFTKGENHPNWKGGIWANNEDEYKRNYSKKHYSENKEKYYLAGVKRRKNKPEKITEYRRRYTLSTREKMYTSIIKRSYPKNNRCELCEKEKRLVYHHWDDSQLKKGSFVIGLWLCNRCHQLAESLDDNKNLGKIYLKFKKINEISDNKKLF